MLFRLGGQAAFKERPEEQDLRPHVEWRQLDPSFHIGARLVRIVGQPPDQLLKQRRVTGAVPAALGCHPVVELRAAIEIQPLQEVPDK